MFNPNNDSIEQFILRFVTPNWKTYQESLFNEFFDTIYIIYPNINKTLTFSNNKLVDSVSRPNINTRNMNFIYRLKHETEKEYKSRIN